MDSITLVFLLPSFAFSLCGAETIDIKDCGSNGAFEVQSLTLSPYPLVLSEGIAVSAAVKINRPLMDNVVADVTISTTVFGVDLDVPCLSASDDLEVGSCTYDVCRTLEKTVAQNYSTQGTCGPYLDDLGYPCTCPIEAGSYVFPERVVTARAPSILEHILSMADYNIRIEVVDDNTKEKLLCAEMNLMIDN